MLVSFDHIVFSSLAARNQLDARDPLSSAWVQNSRHKGHYVAAVAQVAEAFERAGGLGFEDIELLLVESVVISLQFAVSGHPEHLALHGGLGPGLGLFWGEGWGWWRGLMEGGGLEIEQAGFEIEGGVN